MKTIEFDWKELDNLAALIAALEYQAIPYSLRKDAHAIAITIGKKTV